MPVGPRRDGWTPARQAAFIGYLAETRSVAEAARRVGMAREGAYALRRRQGAAGFAAAWDAALGRGPAAGGKRVTLRSAKLTGLPAGYRFRMGLIQVRMYRGRYVASHWKNDNNAQLELLASLDRALRETDAQERRGDALQCRRAFHRRRPPPRPHSRPDGAEAPG